MRASTSTTSDFESESTLTASPIYNNQRTTCQMSEMYEELPTTSTAFDQSADLSSEQLGIQRPCNTKLRSHHSIQDSINISRRHCTVLTNSTGYSIYLLLAVLLLSTLPKTMGRSVAVSAKCYFFGPGTTIYGADYRRDYGVSRKECAEQCKSDVCCMGFEWVDERCTLKSRSLNGTITAQPDTYFGLCLDFDDSERESFYDHELGGSVVSSKEGINRDSCSKLCGYQEDAIIYSWKALDEKNNDELGDCSCIGVLHSIRLSFGSVAGFLM